jgi:peroxiredoxin
MASGPDEALPVSALNGTKSVVAMQQQSQQQYCIIPPIKPPICAQDTYQTSQACVKTDQGILCNVMEDAEYRFEVARAIGSARTELY